MKINAIHYSGEGKKGLSDEEGVEETEDGCQYGGSYGGGYIHVVISSFLNAIVFNVFY